MFRDQIIRVLSPDQNFHFYKFSRKQQKKVKKNNHGDV